MAGLDTQALRCLAGARRAEADMDAHALGPVTFAELGLEIEPYGSPAAVIALARLEASRYLASRWSPASFATVMWRLYVKSGYSRALVDVSRFDDHYGLVADGIVPDDPELDNDLHRAAERLVAGTG